MQWACHQSGVGHAPFLHPFPGAEAWGILPGRCRPLLVPLETASVWSEHTITHYRL